MSHNYLITIGIGRYKHLHENDQLGMSCENDCRDMRAALGDYDFQSLTYTYYSEKEGAAKVEREAHLYNEEATLANIENLFRNLGNHPDFSKNAGQPLHNLMIYYSGHGISTERFGAGKYFSWVPYDYSKSIDDENPDVYELYELETNLMKSLGRIRFKNLILITDSCYSALGLTIHSLVPQTKETHLIAGQEQRSVHAICSCAANRRSFAGVRNSQFTAALVKHLNTQDEDEFRVTTLIDEITSIAIPGQKVFGQKLDIIPDNIGNYTFSCNAARQEKNAMKEVVASLQEGLPRYLNYSKEKAILTQLNRQADSVVIFSNTKDSGLPLMMRSALIEDKFVANEKPLIIVEEEKINYEPTLLGKLFSFFSQSITIEGPIDSEDELVQAVADKLRSMDRCIGLLLNEEVRDNDNLEFVEKLLEIVTRTHEYRQSPFHIHLFILDEFQTDYSSLPLVRDKRINTFLITDKISIKDTELDQWHTDHRRSLTSLTWKHEFIKCYLRDSIYNTIRVNFVESSPEFVIQQICEKAKCPPLAKVLLTRINDKL